MEEPRKRGRKYEKSGRENVNRIGSIFQERVNRWEKREAIHTVDNNSDLMRISMTRSSNKKNYLNLSKEKKKGAIKIKRRLNKNSSQTNSFGNLKVVMENERPDSANCAHQKNFNDTNPSSRKSSAKRNNYNFFLKNSNNNTNRTHGQLTNKSNDKKQKSPSFSRNEQTRLESRAPSPKRAHNQYLIDLKSLNLLKINMVLKSKKCLEAESPFLFYDNPNHVRLTKPNFSLNMDKLFSQYEPSTFQNWKESMELKLQSRLKRKNRNQSSHHRHRKGS